MARKIWQDFMQSRVSEDHRQRTGLPPLEEMERTARQRIAAESTTNNHD